MTKHKHLTCYYFPAQQVWLYMAGVTLLLEHTCSDNGFTCLVCVCEGEGGGMWKCFVSSFALQSSKKHVILQHGIDSQLPLWDLSVLASSVLSQTSMALLYGYVSGVICMYSPPPTCQTLFVAGLWNVYCGCRATECL